MIHTPLNYENCTQVFKSDGVEIWKHGDRVEYQAMHPETQQYKICSCHYKLLNPLTNIKIMFNWSYYGIIKDYASIIQIGFFGEENAKEMASIYLDEDSNLIFEYRAEDQGFQHYMFEQAEPHKNYFFEIEYNFMSMKILMREENNKNRIFHPFACEIPYKMMNGFLLGFCASGKNVHYNCWTENIIINRGEILKESDLCQ